MLRRLLEGQIRERKRDMGGEVAEGGVREIFRRRAFVWVFLGGRIEERKQQSWDFGERELRETEVFLELGRKQAGEGDSQEAR